MIKAFAYLSHFINKYDVKSLRVTLSFDNSRDAHYFKSGLTLELDMNARQHFSEPLDLDRFTLYGIPVNLVVRSE